jgi:hypothetical protein
MDFAMNGLLNVFEFLGIENANQIIILVIILAFGLMYKLGEMAKWVVGIFMLIMAVSLITALYQIAFDARAQCIYAYDDAKPVFADSLQRPLGWNEMHDLNCPTLWVARNEIFYRSGYCFFTPMGYAYFEGEDRKCNHEIDEASTVIGNQNARSLGQLERRKGCVAPPSSCRDLSRVPASKLMLTRGPLKGG